MNSVTLRQRFFGLRSKKYCILWKPVPCRRSQPDKREQFAIIKWDWKVVIPRSHVVVTSHMQVKVGLVLCFKSVWMHMYSYRNIIILSTGTMVHNSQWHPWVIDTIFLPCTTFLILPVTLLQWISITVFILWWHTEAQFNTLFYYSKEL